MDTRGFASLVDSTVPRLSATCASGTIGRTVCSSQTRPRPLLQAIVHARAAWRRHTRHGNRSPSRTNRALLLSWPARRCGGASPCPPWC